MKDERKRIYTGGHQPSDFYQSVGEVPQTMGAGGAFENALERLLANSETNIEKVMDGEH